MVLALTDFIDRWGETSKQVEVIINVVSSLKKKERVLGEKILFGRSAGKAWEPSMRRPCFRSI